MFGRPQLPERLLASILNKYLSEYIDDVDYNNIKLGIFSGRYSTVAEKKRLRWCIKIRLTHAKSTTYKRALIRYLTIILTTSTKKEPWSSTM